MGKSKKLLLVAVAVLVLAALVLCLRVPVQRRLLEERTLAELAQRGYAAQTVQEIRIDHSYFRRIRNFNEWRIRVEFTQEPNIFFWFTWRNDRILFQGVSGDPVPDTDTMIDYSERFKNGTLLPG